jgi:hypothetical protein
MAFGFNSPEDNRMGADLQSRLKQAANLDAPKLSATASV